MPVPMHLSIEDKTINNAIERLFFHFKALSVDRQNCRSFQLQDTTKTHPQVLSLATATAHPPLILLLLLMMVMRRTIQLHF